MRAGDLQHVVDGLVLRSKTHAVPGDIDNRPLTSFERIAMLDVGARYTEEEGERDQVDSWFVETHADPLTDLYGSLVRKGLLYESGDDATFRLTKAGREWVEENRAHLQKVP